MRPSMILIAAAAVAGFGGGCATEGPRPDDPRARSSSKRKNRTPSVMLPPTFSSSTAPQSLPDLRAYPPAPPASSAPPQPEASPLEPQMNPQSGPRSGIWPNMTYRWFHAARR